MTEFREWATHGPGQKLDLYPFNPSPLGSEEVDIAVEYCGLCHSDLSTINDDWTISQYPAIPGREAVSKIVAMVERRCLILRRGIISSRKSNIFR
ncbi:MAG: alcohol dehydrogenase catalytic domain-containing protein [Methylobacter sp.]|nr:alcohol dehydrogenase catalytic domain-containing protein [Methylobacter sp.]